MNISKEAISDNLAVVKKTIMDLTKNDNPGKSAASKAKFYASIRNQKLITLNVILGRAYEKDKTRKDLIKDSLNIGRDELIKNIKSYLHNKGAKLIAALGLVLSDTIQQILIGFTIGKLLGKTLGATLVKLLDKVLDIFYKGNIPPKEKETILDKLKKKFNIESKAMTNFTQAKNQMVNEVAPTMGEMLVTQGVNGYIEEVSKSIAHDLKISGTYLSVFIGIESLIFGSRLKNLGFSAKDIIKMRAPSVIMHVAMAIIHRIPKLKNYAYIIHPLFNILNMMVVFKNNVNKELHKQ